jgi:hypothetical protein
MIDKKTITVWGFQTLTPAIQLIISSTAFIFIMAGFAIGIPRFSGCMAGGADSIGTFMVNIKCGMSSIPGGKCMAAGALSAEMISGTGMAGLAVR